MYDKYEECKAMAPDLLFDTMFVVGFGFLYGIKWLVNFVMLFIFYPICYCKNKRSHKGNPRYRSYFYYLDYTYLLKTGELVFYDISRKSRE